MPAEELGNVIRMIEKCACVAIVLASALTATHAAEPSRIQRTSYLPQPAEPVVTPLCPEIGGRACVNDGPWAGQSQYGGCPTVTNGGGLSAECYAGRPYTLGDLGSDIGVCNAANPLNCQNMRSHMQGSCVHNWWCDEKAKWHCRRAYQNQVWGAHLNNKFNYFIPSGSGGGGTPPFGYYTRVYATEPGYYDARDKQVNGSSTYGVPTAIPLAPGVRYQYNYSWGTPASRLTPISTIAPPRF